MRSKIIISILVLILIVTPVQAFRLVGDVYIIEGAPVYGDTPTRSFVTSGESAEQSYILPTTLENLTSVEIHIKNESTTGSAYYDLYVNDILIRDDDYVADEDVIYKDELIQKGVDPLTTNLSVKVYAIGGDLNFTVYITADDKPMVSMRIDVEEVTLSKPIVRIRYNHPYAVKDVITIKNPSSVNVSDAKLLVDYPPSAFNKPVDQIYVGVIESNKSKTAELKFQKKAPEIIYKEVKDEEYDDYTVREFSFKVYSYENVTTIFELEKSILKGIEDAENITVEVNGKEVDFKDLEDFIKFETPVKKGINTMKVKCSIPTISVIAPAPAKVVEEERLSGAEIIVEWFKKLIDWITSLFGG